jgi:UDP:flavonoid glycosyltransferase YjiC (YdhE family)
MRVLCTTLPEYGHFHSMVPVARALAAGGHEVAFATGEDFCPRVEQAGFTAFPAGLGFLDQLEEASRRYPADAAPPLGPERFTNFVPKMLAGVAAPARARDLVPIARRFGPDVIVHGEAELAGPIVAERMGVPYGAQSVCVLRPLEMAHLAAETLGPVYAEWGVDPGPTAGLFRYLYLDVCPPSLQTAEIARVPVAQLADAEGKPLGLRPTGDHVPYDGTGRDRLPSWVETLSDDPTVYVTLGTLNRDPAGYQTILAGLDQEPVNVIATLGEEGDLEWFGPQRPGVHIERYIPQSLLLPHCDLVVNHAGSILPVLGHGLPLLMVPAKGNEFHNASACVAAGVGRHVPRAELTPERVGREVRALLENRSYRERAGRIADEIERMPGPDHGARLMERLAREGQPLVQYQSSTVCPS